MNTSTKRRIDARQDSALVAREDTLGFLLWDAARTYARHFTQCLGQHGVTLGVWPYLRVLWEEDGLTQRELSERVRMRGPTTVAAVTELERKGWVRRTDDPSDRRKVRIFLTETGCALRDSVMPAVEDTNRLGVSDLNADEQEMIKNLLRRLRDNVLKASAAARGENE